VSEHDRFPSISANLRTAISMTAAWVIPSFFAMALSKRFASGVSRMLVGSFALIPLLYRSHRCQALFPHISG
jgi:hypothetical protein